MVRAREFMRRQDERSRGMGPRGLLSGGGLGHIGRSLCQMVFPFLLRGDW